MWSQQPIILIRYPSDSCFDLAAKAAKDAGALVFRPAPAEGYGVRSTPHRAGRTNQVLIGAEWWQNTDAAVAEISAVVSAQATAWVEVTSSTEAKLAADAGASGLVACGDAAGGWVGQTSTLALVAQVAEAVQGRCSVVARGGIGFNTMAGVMTAGASGVMLDDQMLLATDVTLASEVRASLRQIQALDTAAVELGNGHAYRILSRTENQSAGRLTDAQKSGKNIQEELAQASDFKLDLETLNKGLVALGQDVANAAAFEATFGSTSEIIEGINRSLETSRLALQAQWPLKNSSGAFYGTRRPLTQIVSDVQRAESVSASGAFPWIAAQDMSVEALKACLAEAQNKLDSGAFGVAVNLMPGRDNRESLTTYLASCKGLSVYVTEGTTADAKYLQDAGCRVVYQAESAGLVASAIRAGLRQFVIGQGDAVRGLSLWQGAVSTLEAALERRELLAGQCSLLLNVDGMRAPEVQAAAATLMTLADKGIAIGLHFADSVDSEQLGDHYEAITQAPEVVTTDAEATAAEEAPSGAIAIVGLGSVLPDAPNVEAFWSNLKKGKCSITEVPVERWNPEIFYSADRQTQDATYSKIGGFVRDFDFNRRTFRIPPKVVSALDKAQQVALEAARQALEDAGAFEEGTSFPAERCAVLVGNSHGGDKRVDTTAHVEMRAIEHALTQAFEAAGVQPEVAKNIQASLRDQYLKGRAPINEDTMAGELPNCVAGRIAGTFDLGGANWVVDAACASSLAAINVAVQGLRAGSFDAALVGGSDCLMSPEAYVKFSKIGALSPDGSRPFDEGANGFVMGEGSAMFVMMREADARAAGLRIYARIRGVGASSDGRGKGITAPNPRGQVRALERAYGDAGVDPTTVTMFEAHGTGTPVGDPVEVQSLVGVIGEARYGASLGSVKSNIGHLKAAAGAAAILKSVLAIHHKRLVPTLNVNTPNPSLPLEKGRLKLQLEESDWQVPTGVPRRAGVSAFGFGGTNVHVVLEEPAAVGTKGGDLKTTQSKGSEKQTQSTSTGIAASNHGEIYEKIVAILCERTGYAADEIEGDFELEADLGVDTVKQAEIMAEVRACYGFEADENFRLAEYPTLNRLADYVVERLGGENVAPAGTKPETAGLGTDASLSANSSSEASTSSSSQAADLGQSTPDGVSPEAPSRGSLPGVFTLEAASEADLIRELETTSQALRGEGLEALNRRAASSGSARVAIAFEPAEGPEALAKAMDKAVKAIQTGKGKRVLSNKGIYFGEGALDGKVAFLFPGQGSQYLGMLGDLAQDFPIVRETFAEADAVMQPVLGEKLSSYIFPDPNLDKKGMKAAFAKLTQTEITQPAMLTADVALFRLMTQLGFAPDVVAGHSLGEYGACVAAGVMDFATSLKTVAARGTEMANVEPMDGDVGLMAAAATSVDIVQPILDAVDGYVVCANKNCPSQTVIGGSSAAVNAVVEKLKEAGIDVMLLPVSHAFHTRVVASASEPLKSHLQKMAISKPSLPILSNVTGDYYPESVAEIVDLLSQQVAAPVEYIAEINKMYQDGVRTFVEIGPKRAQTGFVSSILGTEPHLATYTNHPKLGGHTTLRRAVAQLIAAGCLASRQDKAVVEAAPKAVKQEATVQAVVSPASSRDEVYARIVGILCERTGYQHDEIEADFELEADLGIDTVKQAEIMAEVREAYSLEADADFRLAEYPTLGRLADYVMDRMGSDAVAPATVVDAPAPVATKEPAVAAMAVAVAQGPTRDEAYAKLIEVVCEKTGYQADEIEPEFELEADLGIDTVKQAEIMAEVRAVYGLEPDADFRLAEYSTLARLADYVVERTGSTTAAPQTVATPEPVATAPKVEAPVSASAAASTDDVTKTLVGIICSLTGYGEDEIELDFDLEADLGIDTVKQAEIFGATREHYGLELNEDFRISDYNSVAKLSAYVAEAVAAGGGKSAPVSAPTPVVAPAPQVAATVTQAVTFEEVYGRLVQSLCTHTGYAEDEVEGEFELEADLGVDTVKQAEILGEIRSFYGLERDDNFRLSEHPTLNALAKYVADRAQGQAAPVQPAAPVQVDATPKPVATSAPNPTPAQPLVGADPEVIDSDWTVPGEIVCSGVSVGLPSQPRVFADDVHEGIFNGDNHIDLLTDEMVEAILAKHITRLEKGEDGTANYVPIAQPEQSVQLAGQLRGFDLTEDFGVESRIRDGLDRASQLAFAAGLDALRNAHIPLVPRYRTTRTGKKVTIGWCLPESLRDETGVIFASCFTGTDIAVKQAHAAATDPEFKFDPRFLLQVIGMGHARFAEYIAARGPNTRINVACASTTQAIGIAEDWIRLGRCRRVLVIGGDDVTEPEMMQWVGSGFLATGAGTNQKDVTEAALPFDKRRNGTILGAGAVGLVIEKAEDAASRGVVPLADLVSTRFANSAFHATRLDVDHIGQEFDAFVTEAEDRYAMDRNEFASKSVFVSHETFTPARGGSAAAEIESLRSTFGDQLENILITNIKGYTGHPMGAGLEDFFALKSLHLGRAPMVPNLRQPDEDLGPLRYSKGEETELDYAIRFAAGFGSQLAMVLWRRRARSDKRLHQAIYDRWLAEVTGFAVPKIEVQDRVLRVSAGQPVQAEPIPELTGAPYADVLKGDFGPRLVTLIERQEPTIDPAGLEAAFQGKTYALLGADSSFGNQLKQRLEKLGASVVGLAQTGHAAIISDEKALADALKPQGQAVDGCINLLAFGAEDTADTALNASRTSFHAARAWIQALGANPASNHRYLTVTTLGGGLGLDGRANPAVVSGALSGFTKALSREWTDAHIKVLDTVGGDLDAAFVERVLQQFASDNGRVEVGLQADRAVEALPQRLSSGSESTPAVPLNANTSWLVTGGGRGITAAIALSICHRFGGGRFVLTGRSAYDAAQAGNIDLKAARAEIKAKLVAEGQRATPVAIKAALKPLEAQLEIHETLQSLHAAGAQAEYINFDVSDLEATQAAISKLNMTIDGCVHGAGLEDSHLLADKDPNVFDRVFRTKVHGAQNLIKVLGKELGVFVGFSSVAGRFGNTGQVDYSAANDALNKMILRLNTTRTQALAIDWTAWSGIGMAMRGSIKTILESAGVDLLPAQLGAPMVPHMLASGVSSEALVASNLGPMTRGMYDGLTPVEPVAPKAKPELTETVMADSVDVPLLGQVSVSDDGQRLTATTTLDPSNQPFLSDHAIGGIPVLPGVFGMELFALAAKQLAKPSTIHGFEDMQFERPVKFHRNQPVTLRVDAELVDGGKAVSATLSVERVLATGKRQETQHFAGKVLLEAPKGKGVSFVLEDNKDLGQGPSRTEVYDVFFHTGVFQVLDKVPFFAKDAAVAYGATPSERIGTGFGYDDLVSAPFVREMALQAAGLIGMSEDKSTYLPHGISQVRCHGVAKAGETIVIRVITQPNASESVRVFDVSLHTAEGRLLQELKGCAMIAAGPLAEGQVIEATPRALTQTRTFSVVEAENILTKYDMSVQELVTKLEYESYKRLISQDRRREWVAARVAAKSLVRDYIRDIAGLEVSLRDVVIVKDEFGAPSVNVRGDVDVPDAAVPAVSLSHSNGSAQVSIARGGQYRIGLDIEVIEPRSQAFSEYFTEQERSLTVYEKDGTEANEASKITALWCLKEATTKALGLGFHLALSEVLVQGLTPDGRATIGLAGRALDRVGELGATHVEAWVQVRDRFAIAESVIELDKVPKKPAKPRKNRPASKKTIAAVAALLREKGFHVPMQDFADPSKRGEA